jgi:transposase
MAKINTDIGVNINLENAPVTKPILDVGSENIVGKDRFQALADTLAAINPTIKQLADKQLKQEAKQSLEQGQAQINGMTLDQARQAHKSGFPDIYNGWARYGAYKQYAINSVDNFVQDFKDQYASRRYENNYNWQDHYNELSQGYLSDKEGDEFFASAYNEGTAELRRWLNVKEFEKQQEQLQYKVIGNASLSLQNLPTKVEEQLEIAFYNANPIETLGKDYKEKKAKFFQENMSKTFVDMFYNLKENRNPALSLADYDEVVLSEAELHATLDGRFAVEYISLLTTNRPDGSPAIINNPKFQDRVSKLVEKLNEAIKLNVDTANWFNGNVASLPKTDRTELGSDIFDKEYRIRKSQGMSNADAFLSTTMSLMTGMQKNEPIKQIEDLLTKPVTGQYTEDNKLALEVYTALDKAGITGIYFKENDKNKYLFYVANVKSKAGQDPRDIVRELGTANTITKQVSQLTSEDKKSLQTASGNMAYAPNQELFYMVAQYFKNINTDVDNDDYINQTKDFIDKHYSNINGRWVSKFKINQLGTTPDKYDTFKVSAIELLKEKLNVDKKIIQEVDLVGFSLDETNIDVGSYLGTKIDSVDLNNYELIVDDTRDTLYFKESDGTLLDVPATVEYKNGQTVWLEVPIGLVKQRIEEKEAKQREINNNLRMKKDAEFRKKQKRLRELESMGVSEGNLGQGELFKF